MTPELFDNPLGTDGFEFVEYTAPDTRHLARLFESMGFSRIARHRSKDVALYRQGDINFIVNAEPTDLDGTILGIAKNLFAQNWDGRAMLRLIGISLESLSAATRQLGLLDAGQKSKLERLARTAGCACRGRTRASVLRNRS